MWFGYDPLGRCVKRWVGPTWTVSSAAGYQPATLFLLRWMEPDPGRAERGRLRIASMCTAGGWTRSWRAAAAEATGLPSLRCAGPLHPADRMRAAASQEQYDYDAFGWPYFYNAAGTTGAGEWQPGSPSGNRFLFTGREWIKDLRLYDYRNRMYQPELGRFLQPDPKQFEAGDYNLYRYCHNDPVNFTDPDGLADIPISAAMDHAGVEASLRSYYDGLNDVSRSLARTWSARSFRR